MQAGVNIDGGAYYVERGAGTLTAGGSLVTNATRAAVTTQQVSTSMDWLPTTLFLGKGSFDVAVNGNLLLGPVATPFLLPQGANNLSPDGTDQVTFFSPPIPGPTVWMSRHSPAQPRCRITRPPGRVRWRTSTPTSWTHPKRMKFRITSRGSGSWSRKMNRSRR